MTKLRTLFLDFILKGLNILEIPGDLANPLTWRGPITSLVNSLSLDTELGVPKDVLVEDFTNLLSKFGDFSLGDLEKLSSTNQNLAFLTALTKYPQTSETEINTLIKHISENSDVVSLTSNSNIVAKTLETPIEVNKGDVLKIVGDFRIQIGANTAGWTLLQPSGYQSAGRVTEEAVSIQEQILNDKIFSLEVK